MIHAAPRPFLVFELPGGLRGRGTLPKLRKRTKDGLAVDLDQARVVAVETGRQRLDCRRAR